MERSLRRGEEPEERSRRRGEKERRIGGDEDKRRG